MQFTKDWLPDTRQIAGTGSERPKSEMDYLAKWPATEGISPVFTERRVTGATARRLPEATSGTSVSF